MRIAVLALTRQGQCLARRIACLYAGYADVYFKEGSAVTGCERSFTSLSQVVGNLFKEYDGLVFVMAAGIVARVIAPVMQHKSLDPAVVVVDEGGNFAISLLSGHLGGANDLARKIAELVGAAPVITTATDVQGRPAIDLTAKKLGLGLEPFSNLKFINGAIVNGDTVGIYTDMPQSVLLERCTELATPGIQIVPLTRYPQSSGCYKAAAVITDRILPLTDHPPLVFLRPRILAIGLGCRRGTMSSEIIQAVKKACAAVGCSVASVKTLATAWLKADEEGILQAAKIMDVPVRTFAKAALEEVILRRGLPVSEYVREKIGVGAVCEPAALLGADQGELILAKQNYAGITVAVARANCPWWA